MPNTNLKKNIISILNCVEEKADEEDYKRKVCQMIGQAFIVESYKSVDEYRRSFLSRSRRKMPLEEKSLIEAYKDIHKKLSESNNIEKSIDSIIEEYSEKEKEIERPERLSHANIYGATVFALDGLKDEKEAGREELIEELGEEIYQGLRYRTNHDFKKLVSNRRLKWLLRQEYEAVRSHLIKVGSR